MEPILELKETVRRLEAARDTESQIELLQSLNDQLLTRFCVRLGEGILLLPLLRCNPFDLRPLLSRRSPAGPCPRRLDTEIEFGIDVYRA